MKKTISLLLALMLLVTGLSACSNQPSAEPSATAAPEIKATVNAAVLKGPTGMGMAYLMERDANAESKNDYNFTIESAPDAVTAKLVSGELNIAAIPANAAAALYNKTGGKIKIVAVNTLGVLYLMQSGDTVKSVSDLKGKTIISAGQGSTAEYVLNYILAKNNLTVGEDVTVTYVSEHAQAVAQAKAEAKSGKDPLVLLPEPFVTSLSQVDSSFSVAIDLQQEWKKVSSSPMTMGAIAVRTDFIEGQPDATGKFLEDCKSSVEYTNSNPSEASALIEKYGILSADIAQKAIPNANIVFISGAEMKDALTAFYGVLFEANPASIGGKLPADDFYYVG
ncbi:MAG: ABC transporter substrate-binding protein [Clostridiales bacterium]|nr:ABC transporter substrate-binding protein [Clostridiales bacterium]